MSDSASPPERPDGPAGDPRLDPFRKNWVDPYPDLEDHEFRRATPKSVRAYLAGMPEHPHTGDIVHPYKTDAAARHFDGRRFLRLSVWPWRVDRETRFYWATISCSEGSELDGIVGVLPHMVIIGRARTLRLFVCAPSDYANGAVGGASWLEIPLTDAPTGLRDGPGRSS